MKKYLVSIFFAFFCFNALFSQNPQISGRFEQKKGLLILSDDVRIVQDKTDKYSSLGGYHLFIRKKPGIESVMLTETTKDPEGKADSYAYRAEEYNPINGDEIRYLNGKILDSKYSKFSLIDSTPESDEIFGTAFHIFIPSQLAYGYPWTRNGTVKIGKGTFINIRAFEKKYGDYTGDYADNPFMFDFRKPVVKENVQKTKTALESEKTQEIEQKTKENEIQKNEPVSEPKVLESPENEKKSNLPEIKKEAESPKNPEVKEESKKENPKYENSDSDDEKEVILTDEYNSVAAEKFKEISEFGGGKMIFSKGPKSLPDDIMKSLDEISPKDKVDVVFAIDTTGSMKDDMQKLKTVWLPALREKIKSFGEIRLGLLLYRDYGDSYNYMNLPVKRFDFTDDFDSFSKNLLGVKIIGKEGGDIPEAVYEALYASMYYYKWRQNAQRKIILIGDAEPHPRPRGFGKISKDLVSGMAQKRNITIDAIIVPDKTTATAKK